MSDDIAFDRSSDAAAGEVRHVAPLVRRVIAPNGGPFTFTGTATYIVGRGTVAIVDPGPDDPRHLAAVLAAVAGETVSQIVATHSHMDHTAGLPALKAATGAPVVGAGTHRAFRPLREGERNRMEAGVDAAYRPDLELGEGEGVSGPGWSLVALATPGHTANHLAFALPEADLLLSGDHVMAWSTTVVAPPDGAMAPYIASLRKLIDRPEALYLPGHGAPVVNARAHARALLGHRLMREAAIRAKVAEGPRGVPAIVADLYRGLDPRLTGAAGLSVLAHLEDLVDRGEILSDGQATLEAVYRLRGA
jgi:glyoxylase-like metal-dependent hydrolase (beta-lactamase superfamily II)